jgi:hypothetical protein
LGHLVNPTGFRVGFSREWFFGIGRFNSLSYVKTFFNDFRLLEFLEGLFFKRKLRFRGFFFSHFRLYFCSKQSYLVSYLYLPDLFQMSVRFNLYFDFLSNYLYKSLVLYSYKRFLENEVFDLKIFDRVLFDFTKKGK